jgi:uncharacterized membrane protein
MASVARSIEVEVPVTAAFEAWTHYEDLPGIMEGLEHVERLAPDRLRWTGDLGFGQESWEVRILEEIPDLLISWESTSRRRSAGMVTFASQGERTRITLVLDYDPTGVPKGQDHRTRMRQTVDRQLARFKDKVERPAPSPAWTEGPGTSP